MEDKRKTYKMYFLVLYNLSPIQQWIQAWHAAVEYMIDFWHNVNTTERASYDKTFIILNWWTTKTMQQHEDYLKSVYCDYVSFQEPDLWWVTTAIAFLAADDDYILKYFTNNFRLA
jgi:hypothetical protein